MTSHRHVHISLIRSLMKAAKRIDTDLALRAILTTPAEYTNMYNHHGERWEGPLVQERMNICNNSKRPGVFQLPTSHELFSFLHHINGGKSFYNPQDRDSKRFVYPEVISRIRHLATQRKDSGELLATDAKMLSAGFFAMKCIRAVFDIVPVIESGGSATLLPQHEKNRTKRKGLKLINKKILPSFPIPQYMKSLRLLDHLPLICDKIWRKDLITEIEGKISPGISESAKRSNNTAEVACLTSDHPRKLNNCANFLVAHPMLDQFFRHAIILMYSHIPEKTTKAEIRSSEVSSHADVAASVKKSSDSSISDDSCTDSSIDNLNSSMGWIINLPMRTKNGDPLRVSDLKLEKHNEVINLCLKDNIVFSGGPIGSPNILTKPSQHALFLLYCGTATAKHLSNGENAGDSEKQIGRRVLQVAPGVLSITDMKLLQANIRNGRIKSCEILVILGYSGWGKSQLEGEILQGTWNVAAMDRPPDVRSLLLSYQTYDNLSQKSQNRLKNNLKCKEIKKSKKASCQENKCETYKPSGSQDIDDLAKSVRSDLFNTIRCSTNSNVPFPVKMWKWFLHSMGENFVPMSRLSAVLPLRVMSP